MIVGIAADEAYELGRTMALEGAYGLLGKDAPPFTVVPAIKVTADNIVDLPTGDHSPPTHPQKSCGSTRWITSREQHLAQGNCPKR